jgi:hypothetical protein
MSEVKYNYAKDINNNFVNIYDANRENYYYLESEFDGKVEMIVVQGLQYQWHFRSKISDIAPRMTAEHINLQAKLCNSLQFYCKQFDIHVIAKSSICEYRLPNNRIIDVAYFDENNDFLCGIEVVHTNDINDDKFNDLYNSDFLIFKVYTHDPEKFIFVDNRKINTERNTRIHYYRLRNGTRIEGTYFERQKIIKAELLKTDGAEGKLIRDIEQIRKKVNHFIITS